MMQNTQEEKRNTEQVRRIKEERGSGIEVKQEVYAIPCKKEESRQQPLLQQLLQQEVQQQESSKQVAAAEIVANVNNKLKREQPERKRARVEKKESRGGKGSE
eukprot:scaffold55_cov225-Ochromonas_danica.AAC.14